MIANGRFDPPEPLLALSGGCGRQKPNSAEAISVDIVTSSPESSAKKKGDRCCQIPFSSSPVTSCCRWAYCLLAAPAFCWSGLDIPPVTQLLRGLFNYYFLLLAIARHRMVAFGVEVAGGPPPVWPYRGFRVVLAPRFARMDADLSARDAGDPMRCGDWRPAALGRMLCNAVELVAVVGSIPMSWSAGLIGTASAGANEVTMKVRCCSSVAAGRHDARLSTRTRRIDVVFWKKASGFLPRFSRRHRASLDLQ